MDVIEDKPGSRQYRQRGRLEGGMSRCNRQSYPPLPSSLWLTDWQTDAGKTGGGNARPHNSTSNIFISDI